MKLLKVKKWNLIIDIKSLFVFEKDIIDDDLKN
jgi:hypothetical protein